MKHKHIQNVAIAATVSPWNINGGEGGIRTLDRGLSPYNFLAGSRFRPLSHLSTPNFLFCGLPLDYRARSDESIQNFWNKT